MTTATVNQIIFSWKPLRNFPMTFLWMEMNWPRFLVYPWRKPLQIFMSFNCEATGTDGQIATYDNLEGELIAYPDQMQGFRFQAAVVCPSDPNVIVGTYTAVTTATFPDFADPVVDLRDDHYH